jgi:hypothetical protein
MIRLLLSPSAHRDAVVYLAQAAATGPPWLAIVLAGFALLSALGVALAPAAIERVKRGKASTEAAAITSPSASPSAAGAVDLTGEALRDAWAERDEAQRRADRLQKDLTAARAENTDLKVQMARKDARIEWLESVVGRFGTGQ